MTKHQAPLAGIRIVEMDAIGPVPLAAMMLADLGADIVRVTRAGGNASWDEDIIGGPVLYRSRRRVVADLKAPADRDVVLDLIASADAVIEGYRPGVMEKLGLGPDACLARNPALVFARMTGWGQSGPMALRAGHDINYIAITGALHAMGKEGEPPCAPLNLVGDYGGGTMLLVFGVLSALLSARTTGEGRVVDAAMVDGTTSLMAMYWSLLHSGLFVERRGANLLDGGAPFYRCYRCADGRFVAVGCLEPQFFAQMLQGLGIDGEAYDQNDRSSWSVMAGDFERAFLTRSRDEWAVAFEGTDACVTPVLTMAEAANHRHLAARGTIISHRGIKQPGPAPRFSGNGGCITDEGSQSLDEAIALWYPPR